MRVLTGRLGGRTIPIFAPRFGDKAVTAMRTYFPKGGLYGLDVESTGFIDPVNEPGQKGTRVGPGPYHPLWRLRTVQFGTEHFGWVLNVADPLQRQMALDLLSDTTVHFESHTQLDAVAVDLDLGVQVYDRMTDTYFLSVMASPDHREGGNQLKPHVTREIGPELEEYDNALQDEFVKLYNDNRPALLDEDGQPLLYKSGPNKGQTRRVPAVKRTVSKLTGKLGDAPQKAQAYGFTNISVDNGTYLTYAGLDAVAVHQLAPILRKKAKAPATLIRNETWLSQQSMKMSRRGYLVDTDRLHDMYVKTRDAMKEPGSLITEYTGLAPRSPKLLSWFTDQGVDWSDHPRTKGSETNPNGSPSLAAEHVKLLRTQDIGPEAHKVVEALIAYKGLQNRETVTQQILDKLVDGVIHPTIKTIGTVTGRMSGSNPNMQNFSKSDAEMRMLFKPRPGHLLLSCDFAQIELRVLAALSQESVMIKTILEGGDLHTLTATLLNITRQQAKTVNFLIVYGGGGKKLAGQLGFPEDWDRREWISHCYNIIEEYWAQYPAITAYKELVEAKDSLQLISGRNIPVDPDFAYKSLNYMIQGSARELLAGAWMRFGNTPQRADMMWLPIHDELVLEVPEDKAEQMAGLVTEAMTFDYEGVPVQADPDFLIDAHGESRWMSGDFARKCFCKRRGHHDAPNHKGECGYCGEEVLLQVAA